MVRVESVGDVSVVCVKLVSCGPADSTEVSDVDICELISVTCPECVTECLGSKGHHEVDLKGSVELCAENSNESANAVSCPTSI